MATAQYTALANITLGSTASSVTFGSIPNTYRDLMLVVSSSLASGTQKALVRFNGDSASNYTTVAMEGSGSSTYSSSTTQNAIWGSVTLSHLSTDLNQMIIHIMDYSATDKHKTALMRSDNSAIETVAVAGRWANTAAVTSVFIGNTAATNFTVGSTFALYGVK